MKKVITARNLLIVWLIGFAVSFVMQSLLQSWFAEHSLWGPNVGWQNEIAIWNVGVIAMLLGLLYGARGHEQRVLPGLALLSVCFAVNHLRALLVAPDQTSHLLGAFGNVVGVLLYVAYVWNTPKNRNSNAGSPLRT